MDALARAGSGRLKPADIAIFLARGGAAIIAFWLLALGLLFIVWDHAYLRAAMLAGEAALALWALSRKSAGLPLVGEAAPPRSQLIALTAFLALTHGVYCGARLVHVEHLPDIAATTLAATQMAANGQNPYRANIDEVSLAEVGPGYGGYKYLPVMLVIFAPLGLTLHEHGLLLTNLALDLACAAMIYWLARREAGREAGLIAASLYLSLPLVLSALYAKGYTDLAPVALLLASLLSRQSQPLLSGLLCGLSISAKLLPGLAAVPAYIPGQARAHFGLGLALGLIPALLAFASAPQEVFDNIIRFNLIRPMDSSSWMIGASELARQTGRVALGLASAAAALFCLRAANRPAQQCALIALLLFCIILAGPTAHQNYLLWPLPFLCVAMGARVAAPAVA